MKVYHSNSSNNLNDNNDNNDSNNNPPQQQRLKRTRAKRSCDFCRKRKSRCDADTSIPCSNCKAVRVPFFVIIVIYILTLFTILIKKPNHFYKIK